jgi:hypothetical protein
MIRSCLLCVGSYETLQKYIRNRVDSGKKDFMKYVFSIPLSENVSSSSLKLTPILKEILLPPNEELHPGYCGEECRDLLIQNPEFKDYKELWTIVGIEYPAPGCGYSTYDIVFPQGRMDKGENSRDASMREFSEETGIFLDTTKVPVFLGFVGKRGEMGVYAYRLD